MLQYVRVSYFRSRNVYIDGVQTGKTNKILRVDEGTHVFDLGPDQNYEPPSIETRVSGTTAIKPMDLHFEAKG
jgi:hypothetical protein